MDPFPDSERGRVGDREERIAPHEIELIKYRSNRTPLEFRLTSGELVEGAIRWYDDQAIRIVLSDRTEMTLFRHAIVYYKTRS